MSTYFEWDTHTHTLVNFVSASLRSHLAPPYTVSSLLPHFFLKLMTIICVRFPLTCFCVCELIIIMSIKLKFEKFCSFSATHFIDSLRNYDSRHLHLLEEEEGGGGRLFFTQFGSPSLLILPNCCNCHGVIIKLFFSFSEWEKGQKNFLFFFLLSTHPIRIPSQLGRGGGNLFSFIT